MLKVPLTASLRQQHKRTLGQTSHRSKLLLNLRTVLFEHVVCQGELLLAAAGEGMSGVGAAYLGEGSGKEGMGGEGRRGEEGEGRVG